MYPGTSRPNQLHHPYTHTPPGSGFATSSQCFPCHVKRSGSRHAPSSSSTLHHGRFQATAGDVGALPSTQCSPPHCPMSGDAVGGDPIPVSGSVCTWNHCDASCNGAVDDPHGRANFTAQPIRRSPMHARPWIDQGGQHTLRGTWQPEKRHLSTPECAAHVHGGEHEPLLVLDALSRRVDQLEDALRTKDEQVHNLTNLLRLLQTHLHERDEAHKQDMQDTVAKIQQGVAQQQQQVQEDVSIIQEQLLGVMNEQCASQRHLDGALGKIERYVRHLRIQHPRSEKTTSLQEGNDGTNPTQKLMSCRSCGAVATSGGLTANQVSAESKTDANVSGGVNDADMSEGNMRKAGAGSTGVKSALGGGTTPVPSGLQSPDETEILSLHATEAPLLFVRGLCQACHNKSILREACDALRSEFHEQMEDWKRSYHQWRPTWAEELERSVEEACAHRVNVNRCDILLLVDERVTRVLGEMEQCIKSTNQQTQDTLTERMDRMMERFQRQYVQEFEEVCTRMQHQTEIVAQGMDGAQKRTADQIGTFARTLEEWIETTRKFPAELDRLSEQTEKIRTSLKEILDVHQSTRSVLHNEMEEAKHSHSKTTARIRARLDSHSKDIHLLKEELLRLMTEHITHLSRSQQQHSDTVREMLSVHSLHASEASRRFEDRARAQNTTRSLHPEEGEGNHLLAQNSVNDIMNASEVSAIHQVPRAGLRRDVLTPPDLSFTVPPPDLPGSRATRDVTTPQGNVTTSPQKPIAVPIRKRNHKLRSTELDEPLYGSGTKTEHESAGSTLVTFLERSRDRRQELNQLYEQLSKI